MNPKSKLILVGNKIDLIPKIDSYSKSLSPIAQKYDAPIMLTSAKTHENVEQLFQLLGNTILNAD